MGLGASEVAIVLIIALVIFGPDRIPKMARSLGRAKREFEDGLTAGEADAGSDSVPDATSSAAAPSPTGEAATAGRTNDRGAG